MPSLYALGTCLGTEVSEIIKHHFRYTPTKFLELLNYLAEFLKNPERSKTHFFDQQRYATASQECLQLCLCSHQKFSKGAMESAHRDNVLRRSKPSLWIRRLGVHSKIRKGRHHLKRSLKAQLEVRIKAFESFPDNSPEQEYSLSFSYRWALDLLPFFLENSAISLDLVEVLRTCTFTTMGQRFPRRMRLAKGAIPRYLLRAESGVGGKP